MVDIIEPNAPTITIKIVRGQLALNTPDDKMLALSMLSVARALIEKELIGAAALQIPNGIPH